MPNSPQPPSMSQQPPRPSPSPDPFLAQMQSRGINLTAQDRQEGYDVDLVNAQPRGASTSRLSQMPSVDRPQAALTTGNAPISSYGNGAGGGDYSDDENRLKNEAAAGGGGAMGSYGGITSTDPFLLGQDAVDGQMSKRARTKKWILRPLPLAVIVAFICALALALGLGIGLTKERNSDRAAAAAATSGVHTTATPDVSGTVIPSSLWPSTTSMRTTTTLFAGPIQTATTSASSTISTSTTANATIADAGSASSSPVATAESSTTTKSVVSPITSIVYASTGDLPIPANTVTTKDGTVYSSVSTNLHKRSEPHGAGPTTRAVVRWRS